MTNKNYQVNLKDINYYITETKKMTPISSGTGKKCYDFGDVVLLESIDMEPNEMIEKLIQIKKLGINSYEILAQKEKKGKYYILESKVKGTPIQEYYPKIISILTKEDIETNYKTERNYVQQYLNRLKEISENYDHLKKFVDDYFKLIELGIFVDSSKTNNIYYDDNYGYSFLDLQIASFTVDPKMIFHYIFYMISWCYSNIFSEEDIITEQIYLTIIINQLKQICLELQKDPQKYFKNFDENPLTNELEKRKEYRIQYAFDSKEDYLKENIAYLSQNTLS